MTIPHIKLTETMLNKYIIDAKKDVMDVFEIDVDMWGDEPLYSKRYFGGQYGLLNMDDVLIKFYKTARGDKRMSIPKLRKVAEVGDYVWFTQCDDTEYDNDPSDLIIYYNIHIGKELPFDEELYEHLQERFG